MVTLVGKRGLEEEELRRWIEQAENAMDLDEDEIDRKTNVRPRYAAALNPPLVPQRPPGQPLSLVGSSSAAPSFVAASYDQTSPVRGGASTGKPSPMPSPLRTTMTRAVPIAGPSSSSAHLAPPTSSSRAAGLISSDDPLALRSPTQRRLRTLESPPRTTGAPDHTRAASPGKENTPSAKRAASPPPADAAPSSHTERSTSSSPDRPSAAARKPKLAQAGVEAELVAPAAGPSKAPLAPPRIKATSAAAPPAATPNLKSTQRGTAPSSTPRGLDDTAILPTNSRRRAAQTAEKRLHDEIMPDLLDYEKSKRNKTLMTGGRAGRSESAGPSERGSSPDKVAGGSKKGKGKAALAADEQDDADSDEGLPIDEREVKVELRRPAETAAGSKRKLDPDDSDGESGGAARKGGKAGKARLKQEDDEP
jgi:hypothetical protein